MSFVVGYHASHEQHPPSRLLANVRAAADAGFGAAMCSDHLAPFSETQGQSGFAWTWLGAALQATSLGFGTVTAPGQRYHPVIVAQAAATVAEMFPGRFWWALGTGQLVNERMTGEDWPAKPERRARLRECVDIIRALFRGETVSHDGRVRLREARLYVRPAQPPALVGAAVGENTAEWVGSWADALITVACEPDALRRIVEAFRRGGGEGKPMYLQVPMAWAPREDEAVRLAYEGWRTNVAPSSGLVTELPTPAHFDTAAAYVRPEDVARRLRVSASLERHVEWLARDRELGFERVFLHHVGVEQAGFIEAFAAKVLPQLR